MGPTLHRTAATCMAGQHKAELLVFFVTMLLLLNAVHTAATAADDDSKLLELSYLLTDHDSPATGATTTTSNLSILVTSHLSSDAVPTQEVQTSTGNTAINISSSTQKPSESLPSDPAILEPTPPGEEIPGHRPKPPAAVPWAPFNNPINTTARDNPAPKAPDTIYLSVPAAPSLAADVVPTNGVQMSTGNPAIDSSTAQKPSESLPSDPAILEPTPPGEEIPGHRPKPPAAVSWAPFNNPINTTARDNPAPKAPDTIYLSVPAAPRLAADAVPTNGVQMGTDSPAIDSSTAQKPFESLPSDPAIIEPVPPGNNNPGHRPRPPAAISWAPYNNPTNTTADNSSANGAATTTSNLRISATAPTAIDAVPANEVLTASGSPATNSSIAHEPSEPKPKTGAAAGSLRHQARKHPGG